MASAISFFSGGGGLDLGFEQAGFRLCLANELNQTAAQTYQRNFPGCQLLRGDIRRLTPRRLSLIVRDRPDVLVGGPPCQAFSMMGKRQEKDDRAQLIHEFVRMVGLLRPRYFVLENVKGLTLGRPRQVLINLIRQLEAFGYTVPPYQILNAVDYGVPQHRERLFLLGYHEGEAALGYPKPTNRVSVREAIADLPNVREGEVLPDGRMPNRIVGELSAYAREMRSRHAEDWHQARPRVWDDSFLHNCTMTEHQARTIEVYEKQQQGRRNASRLHKLHPDGVAPTATAGAGSFTPRRPIHFRYARACTVREVARLHGFPDWYVLPDSILQGSRIIGNSVPPPLARAVALSVLRQCAQRKD